MSECPHNNSRDDAEDYRLGPPWMRRAITTVDDSPHSDSQNEGVRELERSRALSFRRAGVSAEVLTREENVEKQIIHKNEDAKKRIRHCFSKSYLLQHLDEEQSETIVEAVEEARFNEGDTIIRQGEPGNHFYLLEHGIAEAWILKPGATEAEMVKQYIAGDSFGELALMYNAPRAATVKATTDCILWALDRLTFRAILMTTTEKKRNLYENFLKDVPLLESLTSYQITALADVLEPDYFIPQQDIIIEGAKGDKFYILEEGQAEATSKGKVLKHYSRGDYFGELALLNDAHRAATVTALTKCKTVSINRDQFKAMVRICFTYPKGLTTKLSKSNIVEALAELRR